MGLEAEEEFLDHFSLDTYQELKQIEVSLPLACFPALAQSYEELGITDINLGPGIWSRTFDTPVDFGVSVFIVGSWKGPVALVDKSLGLCWYTYEETKMLNLLYGAHDIHKQLREAKRM